MATVRSSTWRKMGNVRRTCVPTLRGAGPLALATLLMIDTASAGAQRPTRRRQPTIEIRGQVPTPQVVTVRPREVPAYSRQVLVPRFYDHDFWPDIQEGYALMSGRLSNFVDTLALGVDSVGTPDLFRLPIVRSVAPLRSRFGFMRKQYEWCAPHWWCPSHRVRVQMPADSAALFPPRLPPQPMAVFPGVAPRTNLRPDQLPTVQQRWCTPHWWCPPGGIITTPQPTAPADTTRRTPADTTRRPPVPQDSTRRPPGTSSASPLR